MPAVFMAYAFKQPLLYLLISIVLLIFGVFFYFLLSNVDFQSGLVFSSTFILVGIFFLLIGLFIYRRTKTLFTIPNLKNWE
jgi:hypothetical protein